MPMFNVLKIASRAGLLSPHGTEPGRRSPAAASIPRSPLAATAVLSLPAGRDPRGLRGACRCPPGPRPIRRRQCATGSTGRRTQHEVGVNLLEHVLVAALVASAAFYWVLGRQRQKALSRYRLLARGKPWEMVEGSQPKSPVARARDVQAPGGRDRAQSGAALAVVQGRAGTGRTSFIVGLVHDLAERSP